MAFNKRTWKGRQGTGLNKFSINGATPVTVINQPDSVTEQGDALSAGNLNDLEQRIYDAFDDIADGTQIVGKATADASGNVIVQTYETKAEASDLKDAIDNNSQRIENLEVAVSGSLVQTNILTDPPSMANVRTITNANEILPWAILKRVGARAVEWNQLCEIVATIGSKGVTWTNNGDGSFTVTGIATENAGVVISDNSSRIVNHIYLVTGGSTNVTVYSNVSGNTYTYANGRYDNGNGVVFKVTASVGDAALASSVDEGVNAGGEKIYPQLHDLTTIFGDTVANSLYTQEQGTAGKTQAYFRALFPSKVYPKSAPSIIPLNPSAFKVVGKQKWDEVWSAKDVDASTGQQTTASSARISSDNLIPVYGGEVIYAISSDDLVIYAFDIDGNYLGYANKNSHTFGTANFAINTAYTVPSGVVGLRFMTYANYGTSYKNDIMFCLNSVTDKTYEEYKETTIDTSFTSDYKYVNENCHDYSENVLVNGVMKREEHKGIVGEVDLADTSTIVWVAEDSEKRWKTSSLQGIIKNALAGTPANVLGILPTISLDDMTSDQSKIGIAVSATGNVFVRASANDKGASPTGDFFYEKATPSTPTLHDPIPNLPVEDGTTITAVTPQTDLVNSIDVPSTIAYMTKISS